MTRSHIGFLQRTLFSCAFYFAFIPLYFCIPLVVICPVLFQNLFHIINLFHIVKSLPYSPVRLDSLLFFSFLFLHSFTPSRALTCVLCLIGKLLHSSPLLHFQIGSISFVAFQFFLHSLSFTLHSVSNSVAFHVVYAPALSSLRTTHRVCSELARRRPLDVVRAHVRHFGASPPVSEFK